VAASAALAIAVGGAGGVGAYAWVKAAEPREFEIRKIRMQRMADGRCLKQVQVIRGEGIPTPAQEAPPRRSSPGCVSLEVPREFVQR
jgi:hypothetical protein